MTVLAPILEETVGKGKIRFCVDDVNQKRTGAITCKKCEISVREAIRETTAGI